MLAIDIVSLFLIGSITHFDRNITTAYNFLSHVPRSHRYHHPHILSVLILAMGRSERYSLSQDREDLDKSIVHHTEAILLPPISQSGFRTVELLFRLVVQLLK